MFTLEVIFIMLGLELQCTVKPLIKDTPKEANKGQAESTLVYSTATHSNRNSPLKEDNLSTKDWS